MDFYAIDTIEKALKLTPGDTVYITRNQGEGLGLTPNENSLVLAKFVYCDSGKRLVWVNRDILAGNIDIGKKNITERLMQDGYIFTEAPKVLKIHVF